jgi:hypothetical protein
VTYSASRWPSVSTATGICAPRVRWAPSWPARYPLSGLACTVRLSKMTAVGVGARPSASRSSIRRSSGRRRSPQSSRRPASAASAGQRPPKRPRRQVVRDQAPRCPGAHDPAQRSEDLPQAVPDAGCAGRRLCRTQAVPDAGCAGRRLCRTQAVPALPGVLRQQTQIRRHECPLVVTHIARVRLGYGSGTAVDCSCLDLTCPTRPGS